MELEKQVSNLELSTKLEELGVPQKSLFYWTNQPKIDAVFVHEGPGKNAGDVSAFNVAELGEMLPPTVGNRRLQCDKLPKGDWWVSYTPMGYPENEIEVYADTEADARAKMLIYLIENGLYEPQK